MEPKIRGPKGHITCTWVQCATFLTDQPFLLTHQPEKHKLGRRCWDLAYCQICWIPFNGSCQFSLNSVQRFQRRSQICLSQSEAGAAILFFWPTRKTQTWKRTLRSCFLSNSVEFRSAVSEEKPKMSQPIRGQGGHLVFPIAQIGRVPSDLASFQVLLNSVQRFQRSQKCLSESEARAAILFFRSARKTQTWWKTLRSYFLSSFVEFREAVSEEKTNMSQPIRGQGGHLVSRISPKNTNLVEDVGILLPVKFRWIPFSSFRREVKNVSANQRPGRPSCFSNRPEKRKLDREQWDRTSCQVSLNSLQQFQRRSTKCENFSRTDDDGQCAMTIAHSSLRLRSAKNANLLEDIEILLPVMFLLIPYNGFRGEVENVSANQRPGRPSCFSDWPKKHKFGRGHWDLASCQV